jgi:hypothetical protein
MMISISIRFIGQSIKLDSTDCKSALSEPADNKTVQN